MAESRRSKVRLSPFVILGAAALFMSVVEEKGTVFVVPGGQFGLIVDGKKVMRRVMCLSFFDARGSSSRPRSS